MKLGEIAKVAQAELEGDPEAEIKGLAVIENAGAGELTFLSNPRYRTHLKNTQAGAIFLAPGMEAPPGCNVLRTPDPYLAFTRVIPHFYQRPRPAAGVHPSAVVDPGARLGKDLAIGALVVIEGGAEIGDRTEIGPNATIHTGARIGADCVIHSNVVVREYVRMGDRVILQNGAIIGADGFGFAPTRDREFVKMIQAGTVILGDDVEIGANTTVDRATVGATVIGRGTKLDNLVQIGHGCTIGENTVVAAQAALAGSMKGGSRVMIGGQSGLAGHARVGNDVQMAARTGVSGNVPDGAQLGGTPSMPFDLWKKAHAALAYLPDVLRRLRRVERTLGMRGKDKGRG
ncbi:MAG: UDP-3-O-(3-hydroxymyristoyl)glucosamine N-acyltransferase [Myxococcota bacterium]